MDELVWIEFQRMRDYPQLSRRRDGHGVHGIEGCLDPEFKDWGEGEGFVGGGNRMSNGLLMRYKKFGVCTEKSKKVKSDGIVISRLKNQEIKIEMMNESQPAKALNADLRRPPCTDS